MKFFENTCTFDYAWKDVSVANWRKYCAWNDRCSHVIAVDTLSRRVDPSTGILITERLITCRQSVPRWLLKLVGGTEVSYVHETSSVDRNLQTVLMRSTNLTGSNILSVQETVVYRPDPQNQDKTLFEQHAQITAYGAFTRLCNAVEDWSVERFGQNAKKGREGFESVLEMSARAFRDLKEQGEGQAVRS